MLKENNNNKQNINNNQNRVEKKRLENLNQLDKTKTTPYILRI